MGLNDILLSPELLEKMYNNVLVIPAHGAVTRHASPKKGYPVLGKNKKNICLLIDSPGTAFIPDQHLVFMTKLLEACKLTGEDISVVNQASGPLQMEKVLQQFLPKKLFLFGISPKQLGIDHPLADFETINMDGCQIFCFPSLDQINQDTADGKLSKGKLWTMLKKTFDL